MTSKDVDLDDESKMRLSNYKHIKQEHMRYKKTKLESVDLSKIYPMNKEWKNDTKEKLDLSVILTKND